jgi:branched-chain amino acid transport system ATP-binding protein
VGSNGAGKSTLLKAILGFVRVMQGTIKFSGHDLQKLRTHQIASLGIGYVPEGRQVFPEMTVAENLAIGAYSRKIGRAKLMSRIEEMWALFPRLYERRNQLAGSLSGGEQQMLAVARALMAQPTLLLMDEPSMGLAPALVEVIIDTLAKIRDSGVSVLIAEQNAYVALSVASRIYAMEAGSIVFSGTREEAARDERLKEAYFGVKARG